MDNPQERLGIVSPDFIAGIFVGEGYFGIAVRKHRLTNRHKIQLLPAASFDVLDAELVDVVARSLSTYQMPHWVYHAKRGANSGQRHSVRIHGLKRLVVFLPWITPRLVGMKKKCAENLLEYVRYRLSLPHQAPVTEKDLDFVRTARSLNARKYAEGGHYRETDLETISRILRDCTSGAATSR